MVEFPSPLIRIAYIKKRQNRESCLPGHDLSVYHPFIPRKNSMPLFTISNECHSPHVLTLQFSLNTLSINSLKYVGGIHRILQSYITHVSKLGEFK